MSVNIIHKHSDTPLKRPTTSSMVEGEISINTYDGAVYLKKSSSIETVEQLVATNSTTVGNIIISGSTTLSGSLLVSGALYDNLNQSGTSGQMIQSTGTGFVWTDNVAESAQALIITGKNMEGTVIPKGTPLYFSGSNTSGNIVGAYIADATDANRMPAGGIAAAQIEPGAEGDVFIYGFINGVDTSQFAAGDDVFVAPGGGYTNVKPTGSAFIQKLGNVEKSDVNGSGVIQGPSWYNDLPNWEHGRIKIGQSDTQPVTASYVYVNEPNSEFIVTGSLIVTGSIDINGVSNLDDTQITGSLGVTGSVDITGETTIYKSGSVVFTVQGSSGELFSVTDSLSGSLFSVNDISGLPVLEAFSNGEITIGAYDASSLYTTVKTTVNTGTTAVYAIPTASLYTGAWFEYTIQSGSNLRAGTIQSVWSGSAVNYTETTTADLGSTTDLTFEVLESAGNIELQAAANTDAWTIKSIIRSI